MTFAPEKANTSMNTIRTIGYIMKIIFLKKSEGRANNEA